MVFTRCPSCIRVRYGRLRSPKVVDFSSFQNVSKFISKQGLFRFKTMRPNSRLCVCYVIQQKADSRSAYQMAQLRQESPVQRLWQRHWRSYSTTSTDELYVRRSVGSASSACHAASHCHAWEPLSVSPRRSLLVRTRQSQFVCSVCSLKTNRHFWRLRLTLQAQIHLVSTR